jgi:hypothetical protein
MDKRKLANIIIKDLEEIKNLSEEVAESQEDSLLVIDLALNRARLLVQEIELLRELAGSSVSTQEENSEDDSFVEEDEVSDISFSDPELEILHFEERELPEEDEEEEAPEKEEEIVEEDFEQEDKDEEDDFIEEEEQEVTEEEFTEEEEDDNEDDLEEEEEIVKEKIVKPQIKNNIQVTELKNDPQSGIREIHIDDLDDEDEVEATHFSTLSGSTVRPPMKEIPKPENAVIGETFQKERSLNDSIGENKFVESKLTNSPITNLQSAIGLNDRFIFIREIFGNNTEKYNTIIEKLDKLENIQQAVEYLKANLTMQKNDASIKFVDLLKRRFTK